MRFYIQKNRNSARKGFTLLELLVVITIFGLLASISIYSIAQARTRAENSRTNTQVKNYIQILQAYELEHGSYPLTSGTVCLGGTSCGISYSSALNAILEKYTPAGANPGAKLVAFNTNGTPANRAWYARCDDLSGYCDNDDIAEVVWYLEGSTADCGSGASRYVSEDEGNVACVYKLSGIGTTINEEALGYDTGVEENCSYNQSGEYICD